MLQQPTFCQVEGQFVYDEELVRRKDGRTIFVPEIHDVNPPHGPHFCSSGATLNLGPMTSLGGGSVVDGTTFTPGGYIPVSPGPRPDEPIILLEFPHQSSFVLDPEARILGMGLAHRERVELAQPVDAEHSMRALQLYQKALMMPKNDLRGLVDRL